MFDKKTYGLLIFLSLLILLLVAINFNNRKLSESIDLSQVVSNEKQDTEALGNKNSFYAARSEREQQDSTSIQSLNSIISDANTSKKQKDAATKELAKKEMTKDNEGRIELSIKNKGYEDALCRLDSNKATVIVKASSGLQESETVAIQEIVQDVSKIKDVIIEVQK